MGRGLWKEALGRTWRDKWEETLAILGGITTVLAGGLPVWMRLMWLGVSGLLLLRVLSAFRRTVLLLKEKHVPLVVLVGRDPDTARAMWGDVQRVMARWGFDEERYRREFDVEREDVFLHHAAPLPPDRPDEWLGVVRDFRHRIERVSRKLPGRRVFHVFINGPISLAVGLGASIGTMYEVVVHQWFPGAGDYPYYPVVDFYALSRTNPRGVHYLEDPVEGEFRYAQGAGYPGDKRELYIALWMARDDPRPAVNALVRQKPLEEAQRIGRWDIMRKPPGQTLETGDDWILCAREILTLIHRPISEAHRDRVHLFLSAPIALAFALGMGLEHFLRVTIYSWWPQTQQYYPVLDLERLGRTASAGG
jgi:hypothetical protein